MIASLAASVVPWNLMVLVGFIFLVCALLVWYALRRGGSVRAVFSHGKTTLELEAKEREADKWNLERAVGVPLLAKAPAAPLHDVSFNDPG